jgi:hypothetical protein
MSLCTIYFKKAMVAMNERIAEMAATEQVLFCRLIFHRH